MRLLTVISSSLALLCLSREAESMSLPFSERNSSIDSVIAFGDSYSDNGSALKNFYYFLENTPPTSFKPKLIDSFYIKTVNNKRWSNGLLCVEHLANKFDNATLYDFARSGATANNRLTPRFTQDVHTQIQTFVELNTVIESKKNTLFTIWVGVNDVTDIFKKYPVDSKIREAIVDAVVSTIRYDMEALYSVESKNILLMGLLPLETAPMFYKQTDEAKKELIKLVSQYNDKLTKLVDEFSSNKTDIHASFFDTHSHFRQTYSEEVTNYNAHTHCGSKDDCGELIWWDNLHPTTLTHEKIADSAYNHVVSLGW